VAFPLDRPPEPAASPYEVASVTLPTPYGEFRARAFQCASGCVYLALVRGEVTDRRAVLTRLHSECLTGDALGSLRCDCGVQLRTALRAVAAEGRGVVLYLTGHEGRGIGLVNKLRAYVEQDRGADTVDANLALGLPADGRDYADAASVLASLGVRSVRLLTNNPDKARAVAAAGIAVAALVPLPTAAHQRNRRYLQAKADRFRHRRPAGGRPAELPAAPTDVAGLLGAARPRAGRPYVLVKYAQTLDGRIATGTGDSKWISGEPERRLAHGLRAACDAVLVGAGTVLRDDPRLTVRMVPGANPIRIVLDSTLRVPVTAQVYSADAATVVYSTPAADPRQAAALAAAGVAVRTVPTAPQAPVVGRPSGVDVAAVLADLRASGVQTLMAEGGAAVITALLAAGVVDRLVVSISPTIIGAGVEAVGALAVARVADGVRLDNRCLQAAGDDLLLGWDVLAPAGR